MERATQPQQPPPVAEELNLDFVKIQTQSLQKSISRLLEDINDHTQNRTTPKWKDILGRYSAINLDLFILMEAIQQVSKAFVVLPKNVNAENASILPVMLSSKLLPEMEIDNKVKSEQLLQEVQSLPIPMQIETLKERISRIAEACESAGKVMADARKDYGFAPHRGLDMLPPTIDKVQAAKIQEQESILRGAVNEGTGLRLPPDQREITTALPPHMVDALFDPGNNALPVASNSQGNPMQVSGTEFMGSSGASSSGATTRPISHASQMLGDQMFNSSGIIQTQQSQSQQQQQQHGDGGGDYGNVQTSQQNAEQRHQNPQ